MIDADRIAEENTIQALLNCYLREVGGAEWHRTDEILDPTNACASRAPWTVRCHLPHLDIDLLMPVRYASLTWRNLFDFPVYYRIGATGAVYPLDCAALSVFLCQGLNGNSTGMDGYHDLVARVIDSCRKTSTFLDARHGDMNHLFSRPLSFIEAEQSLLLGHALHPTPKSRQNITDEDLLYYSPEIGGAFPLHYYHVHRSLIREASLGEKSASRLVTEQLLEDPELGDRTRAAISSREDWAVVPVHPRQADILRRSPKITSLQARGLIEDLGPAGSPYQPTISVRTVYRREAEFMYKLSLGIEITNSRRMNLFKELERGLEIARLLETPLGRELGERFPNLSIITDPAYLAVVADNEVLDDFSMVLRTNPFGPRLDHNVYAVVALCQQPPDDRSAHLAREIRATAARENRSTENVALDWLDCWMERLVEPVLWLYGEYGLALEPHQQNTLVRIDSGYPDRFYYRDNQGYYYCTSRLERLNTLMPGVGEVSQTACDDNTVAERLGYYLFVNNICGLINALGMAGCLEEKLALSRVREYLAIYRNRYPNLELLIDPLLTGQTVRCKSNLLTRFHRMDELSGPVASQSVYVDVRNPFVDSSHE